MSSFKLWIYKIITMFLPESRCFRLKTFLLRWAGAKIGENVRIYSSAKIMGNGNLIIGSDVHVGPQVCIYLSETGTVTIGSYVDIAPRVTFLTGTHCIDPHGEHIAGSGLAKSITIGDGSWLGACCTFLPGVTLAKKTVVAAGAVVCSSVMVEQALVAGVPAKIKKSYCEP